MSTVPKKPSPRLVHRAARLAPVLRPCLQFIAVHPQMDGLAADLVGSIRAGMPTISISSILVVLALIILMVGSSFSVPVRLCSWPWAEVSGVCAVLRADRRNTTCGIDGIAGELALPCALAPRPTEAPAFNSCLVSAGGISSKKICRRFKSVLASTWPPSNSQP